MVREVPKHPWGPRCTGVEEVDGLLDRGGVFKIVPILDVVDTVRSSQPIEAQRGLLYKEDGQSCPGCITEYCTMSWSRLLEQCNGRDTIKRINGLNLESAQCERAYKVGHDRSKTGVIFHGMDNLRKPLPEGKPLPIQARKSQPIMNKELMTMEQGAEEESADEAMPAKNRFSKSVHFGRLCFLGRRQELLRL